MGRSVTNINLALLQVVARLIGTHPAATALRPPEWRVIRYRNWRRQQSDYLNMVMHVATVTLANSVEVVATLDRGNPVTGLPWEPSDTDGFLEVLQTGDSETITYGGQ